MKLPDAGTIAVLVACLPLALALALRVVASGRARGDSGPATLRRLLLPAGVLVLGFAVVLWLHGLGREAALLALLAVLWGFLGSLRRR